MTTTQTSAIAAKGFDFVMFQTADMKKARAFYEGLFGIVPGAIESEYFVEYELADGNTFALGHNPSAPFVAMGGIMFSVDDAQAGRARVEALGGTFHNEFGGDSCTTAWCTDPDGNYFGLHQRKV